MAALAIALPAQAIVNQVDGTIVPVTTRMQQCLDMPTAQVPVPGEGPGLMNAVRDAATRPQTFVPDGLPADANRHVFFSDVGEGAGYQNRFGWYHVGDSPFDAARRHEIFDCRTTATCDCPCSRAGGVRAVNGPTNSCTTWMNANIVRVDFACLGRLAAGDANRWDGRPLAFYIMTPELLAGGGSGCAPVGSTTNRVYSTDNTVNDDGDYVHFLIENSAYYPRSYYFGWEDLFRGGDNDFEDILVRATGLVPSCNPSPEICDGRDNNCDGRVDESVTQACSTACGGGSQACMGVDAMSRPIWGTCSARVPAATETLCDGLDDNCNGLIDEGLTQACVDASYPAGTTCRNGVQYCTGAMYGACVTPAPQTEVCDALDNNCNGTTDENLGTATCGTGVCRRTVANCVGGVAQTCVPGTGSAETCNGLDDDCNGQVDEGVT
ncbi:MAG: DUF4114 domain-containing protein, partial [Deltaproteobacteria bacterium]